MNPIRIAAVSIALLGLPCAVFADGLLPDPLVKELGGDLPPTPRTPEELEVAYAKVLPGLIAKPEADDTALRKIVSRAGRPGAEVERATLSKVLADRLGAEQSISVKVMLLRHIQRIGRVESVSVVAALLDDRDAQVRECARRALAGNPTTAAAQALRAALDRAEDSPWKGALLLAIAYRNDPADAGLFANAAASADENVRIPALLALARAGSAADVATVTAARDSGSDAAKAAANDACLLLADRLVALNQRPAAASIYREYLSSPSRYRYPAIVGLGAAGTERDLIALLDFLGGSDPQAKGAALQALAHRPSAAIAEEVFTRYAKADPAAKPWLLRALVEQDDARAPGALLDALAAPDEALRLQAITGLARVGQSSAAAVSGLLKSAAGKGEEQAAARVTLEVLPDRTVDDALLQRLATGAVAERTEVIRALAARHTQAAVAPLFDTAGGADADPAIRTEAFKSLAAIAGYDTLPRTVALLVKAAEDIDREQAVKTVVAIARKNDDVQARVGPLLTELDGAEGPVRSSLLTALGQLGGEKALAALRTAIRSDDEKTHEAGVRALANWPDVAPLADLLALAKDEKSNTLSVLSLRGYVRLIALPSKRTAAETIKLYLDAFPATKRPDERKMILGGLGEIKDAKALEAVAPYLSDEALTGEACAAAVKIAKETWQSNKELARSAMNKVLEVSKNDAQKKSAKEVLDKLAPQPPKPASP